MKVVIAMDSFKGSLTSLEAGKAIERGIQNVCDAKIVVKSIADGGEGTTNALVEGSEGSYVSVEVTGPIGKKTTATYGILADGNTVVMEMSQAAGLTLVPDDEKKSGSGDDVWCRRDDFGCDRKRMSKIFDWDRRKRDE